MEADIFRSVRAQKGKLVVVAVFRSKGPYYEYRESTGPSRDVMKNDGFPVFMSKFVFEKS